MSPAFLLQLLFHLFKLLKSKSCSFCLHVSQLDCYILCIDLYATRYGFGYIQKMWIWVSLDTGGWLQQVCHIFCTPHTPAKKQTNKGINLTFVSSLKTLTFLQGNQISIFRNIQNNQFTGWIPPGLNPHSFMYVHFFLSELCDEVVHDQLMPCHCCQNHSQVQL